MFELYEPWGQTIHAFETSQSAEYSSRLQSCADVLSIRHVSLVVTAIDLAHEGFADFR